MSHPDVDFIGIGFPRCGTTWLGKCLAEHPEICFSQPKEAHFFDLDYHYEKGLSFYEKHFEHRKEGQVVGEFTPEYIREPEKCAKRIKKFLPDVKLVVVLRDPVVRSFSHYRYRKYKSGTYKNFRELIDNFESDPVIDESHYLRKLQPFLDWFKKENMLFLVHEESLVDPEAYMQRVYDFLAVDSGYKPAALRKKVNITNNQGLRFPKTEHWLNNLRWKVRGSSIGRVILVPVRALGLTKLISKLRGINRKPVRNPEDLSEVDYVTMWEQFKPEMDRLEKVTGIHVMKYWGDASKSVKNGL